MLAVKSLLDWDAPDTVPENCRFITDIAVVNLIFYWYAVLNMPIKLLNYNIFFDLEQ